MKRLSILSLALVTWCTGLTLLLTPQVSWGQSTVAPSTQELLQSFVQVTLNDGTLKYGTLLSIDDNDVVLDIVGLGATRIPKYLIQSLSSLGVNAEEAEQGYSYVNQANNYFALGTPIGEGRGYFNPHRLEFHRLWILGPIHRRGHRFCVGCGDGSWRKGERQGVDVGGWHCRGRLLSNLDRPMVLGFANVTLGDDQECDLERGSGNRFEDGYYYGGVSVDSTLPADWQAARTTTSTTPTRSVIRNIKIPCSSMSAACCG